MTNKLALVVAVVLGVLSILGVRFYVEKIKNEYINKVSPIDVPVATRDLKPGDVVQKADIAIQQFPHDVINALGGSHYNRDDTDKFENAKVVAPIKQGQVYQQYHFRVQRQSSGKLPPVGSDFRAVTILVNQATGLSNMLRPGDKVDIVITAAYEEIGPSTGSHKGKLKVTSTLAQKVDVVAVDNTTDADTQSVEYNTVTVKLHPEDVNRLMHAADNGWPYHLVKIDDTASASASANPVFADTEYSKIEPEVKRFMEERFRNKLNNPQPPK